MVTSSILKKGHVIGLENEVQGEERSVEKRREEKRRVGGREEKRRVYALS